MVDKKLLSIALTLRLNLYIHQKIQLLLPLGLLPNKKQGIQRLEKL